VVSFSIGDIEITTEDNPEGGIGVYKPQIINVYAGLGRAFSDRIFAGFNVKVVHHSIGNVSGQAFALDGGILYATGNKQELKFGLAIRNLGAKMRYSGEGLAVPGSLDEKIITLEQRSKNFELPSQMLIGASYDFYPFAKGDTAPHRITPMLTFVSNAFGKDQVKFGIEYGYMKYLKVRVGLMWEEGIFTEAENTSVYKGYSLGAGLNLPLSQSVNFSIDYAYQPTVSMGGNHLFGINVTF